MLKRLALFSLLILLSGCQAPDEAVRTVQGEAAESVPPEPERLQPGQPLRHSLQPGQTRWYLISLHKDEVATLEVEQQGVDVRVVWDGVEYDSPTGRAGAESVLLMTQESRRQRIQVTAFDGAGMEEGEVILRLRKRPVEPGDAERLGAHRHSARAFQRYSRDDFEGAVEVSGKALEGWIQAGDQIGIAKEHLRLGDALWELKRSEEAAEHYRHGLKLAEELGLESLEGRLINNLGAYSGGKGEVETSRERYSRALEIGDRIGDSALSATALGNLGLSSEKRGEWHKALDFHLRSLEQWRRVWNPGAEVKALLSIGRIYFHGHDDQAALEFHQRALVQAERLHDPELVLEGLAGLGRAQLRLGDLVDSRASLAQALEIAEVRDGLYSSAYCTFLLGEVARLEGRLAEARNLFEDARRQAGETDNVRGLAAMHLARVAESEGDASEALHHAQQSYRFFVGKENPAYLASTHWVLARANLAGGDLEAALEEINTALRYVGQERDTVPGADWSANIADFRYDYFELKAQILLRLEERSPGEGHLEAAFTLIEHSRARNLLESGPYRLPTVDEEGLSGEAAALWREIRDFDLKWGGNSPQGTGTVPVAEQLKFREMVARYRLKLNHLRRQQQDDSLDPPILLSLAEMQSLLDSDTRVLNFLLGEERSVLWVLAPDSLRHYFLPPRRHLERWANLLREELSIPGSLKGMPQGLQDDLAELAGDLLGQALAELDGARRWVVLLDGSLHYLPMAALIDPRTGRFLVQDHEFVSLPSLAVVERLARKQQDRQDPSAFIGIVTDPVFNGTDERFEERRVQSAGSMSLAARKGGVEDSAEAVGLRRYHRLRASDEEAEAILDSIPSGLGQSFSGFEAQRELLLEGDMADFRYLHLIAHGEINLEYPELSSLVFSMLDSQGQPVDGLVRHHEIYDLDLASEMVVLSACETAIGKARRGEGLMGFSQAFFHIGVPRLVVSLWQVDDHSTAELMAAFYRALLEEGHPPAEALRQAQKAMLERYPHPYFWAPFVFQGDWR